MNNSGTHTPNSVASDGSAPSDTSNTWISKSDRHLQLINSAVYEKESQNRTKAIEETRQQKLRQRDQLEKAKLLHFVTGEARGETATGTNSAGPSARYEVNVNGIRFVVAKNGSKLIKLPGMNGRRSSMADETTTEMVLGDVNAATTTPKTAVVGGVKFYRSKNGNLYRDGVVRAHRYVPAMDAVPTLMPTDDAANLVSLESSTSPAKHFHRLVYPSLNLGLADLVLDTSTQVGYERARLIRLTSSRFLLQRPAMSVPT
jgi:hypothetical protein